MRDLALTILCVLASAVALSRLWAGPARDALVERPPRAELHWPEAPDLEGLLERERPDVAVLGNSVTAAAVDADALGEALGLVASDLTLNGSASALWYLLLKNVVARAEGAARPRVVVLGFRDVFLTEPDYRTDGRYRTIVDWFADADEPLLDRRALLRDTGELELLALGHWSAWQRRAELRAGAEALAKEGVAARIAGRPPGDLAAAVDRVFAEERKRDDAVTAAQSRAEVQIEPYHFDFGAQLERSLLPEMIRSARAADVRLVLVRMPNRRSAEARVRALDLPDWASEWLPGYMDGLLAYLAREGVDVIDLDGDPRIPFEWYANGDHLGPDPGRREFTRILAEELAPLLQR